MLRAVNVNLWASSSDSISIYFDDQLFLNQYPRIDVPATLQNNCGNVNHDFIWYVTEGVTSHSSNTLTLKYVISNSGYNTASYGLYMISIIFRTTTPLSTHLTCVNSPTGPLGACTSFYTGSCDTSCETTCFGPGSTDCYSCNSNYFFDGIHCLICDSSCGTCKGPASNQCAVCTSPSILQADGTCSTAACTSPYILDTNGGNFKQCIFDPCPTGYFIFYNLDGSITCMATCTDPYTVYNIKFCQLCAGQYRAYDEKGTLYCKSYCAAPYQPRQNNQYCLLCDLGEFIWYNPQGQLVCLLTCPHPYQPLNSIYCLLCPTDEFIYNTATGDVVCMKTCSFPYTKLDSTHCILPTVSIISATQTLTVTSAIVAKVLLLATSGASGLLFFSPLADMFKYIRYMDIRYSQKLIDLFTMKSISSMIVDQLPSLEIQMTVHFPEHPLPPHFETYDEKSNFIANCWLWLFSLILIVLVTIINNQLTHYISKSIIRTLAIKLKAALQWNYCIFTFVQYYGSLVLYSSLQFLTASSCNSGFEVLSIVICVIMSIIGLALLGKIATVIWRVQRNAVLPSPINLPETEQAQTSRSDPHPYYTSYGIVLEDFKPHSLLKQGFFVVYIVRVYIFSLSIVFMYTHPIVQGCLFSLLALMMLIYLLAVQPMKKMLDLISSIVQELILLVVNVCITVLSVLDTRSSSLENGEARSRIENVVLWCNITFSCFMLLYTIIIAAKQIHLVYVVLRRWCKAKSSRVAPHEAEDQMVYNTTGNIPMDTICNPTDDSRLREGPSYLSIVGQQQPQKNDIKERDDNSYEQQTNKRVNSDDSSLIQNSGAPMMVIKLRDWRRPDHLWQNHNKSPDLSFQDNIHLNEETQMNQTLNNNGLMQKMSINADVMNHEINNSNGKGKNRKMTKESKQATSDLKRDSIIKHEEDSLNPSAVRSPKGGLENSHQTLREVNVKRKDNDGRAESIDEPREEQESMRIRDGFKDKRSQRVFDYNTYMEHHFRKDALEIYQKK